MNEEKAYRGLHYVHTSLEYQPVRTDPGRGVHLPGVQGEEEMSEEFGPLTTFVLGLGRFISLAAVFGALGLMMLIARG